MRNEYTLRYLFAQVLFLLSVWAVQAQETHHYIVEIRDMEGPIANAEVEVSGMDVHLTDSAGLASFHDPRVLVKVEVRMQGYYTLQQTLKVGRAVLILSPEVNFLDQVVFSEGKTEKQVKRSTVSLELVQPEFVIQTAPTNIQQSFNRISGVQIVDGQANIRSGSGWSYGAGSRVQVLVNGIPMLTGDAAQPQWSFIPTEGIERVEVLKGASSVIYGSSALNGVINIETKRSGKSYTQVDLTTGMYDKPARESLRYRDGYGNLSNISAFHLGKLGALDMNIGVNGLYDDSYKMHDDERRARLSFGLQHKNPERNEIYGVQTAYQRGISSSFLLWESYEQGYVSLDSGDTESKTSRFTLDPYYQWSKGNRSHRINARYLNVANDVDNGDTSTDQSNFSDLVYTEYQFTQSIPAYQLELVSGVVGQWSQTRSPLFNGTQNTRNAAAYLQLEKRWSKLLINSGLRYEHYQLNDRTEGKPVFRAGLNYEVATASFLRLSYGQGYRFPSVAETYITTSVGPVSIYPNVELESEEGQSIELGFKQGIKIGRFKGFVDVALFDMRFERMTEFLFERWKPVQLVPLDLGVGFRSINAGKTRVQGIEAGLTGTATLAGGRVSGFVGYTYVKAWALDPDQLIDTNAYGNPITYRNSSTSESGDLLKYRPQHSLKMDVSWEWGHWNLGYGFRYQSEMQSIDTAFVSPPISDFVPGVQEAMDAGLSAFFMHNVRLGYKPIKSLKISLIGENVSNQEYMIRPADIGYPRKLRLQIGYTFD